MSDAVRLEVQGLEETQRKVEQMVADLQGPPLIEAMREQTLLVTRDAKIFAPVDTGRMVTSILPSVVVNKVTRRVEGFVGTAVEYGPAQEARPANVPTQESPKGGKFLARALAKNLPRIKQFFGRFVARIVSK